MLGVRALAAVPEGLGSVVAEGVGAVVAQGVDAVGDGFGAGVANGRPECAGRPSSSCRAPP